MKLFEKILCPIDFSEHSVRALLWTQHLAKHYQAPVTILHVLEPYPILADIGINYDAYCSAVMRDMQSFLAPLSIPYETVHSSGTPAEKIVTLASSVGASLIVLGTRGLRGAAHRLIGSTAERVIRHSPVPVMTISPNCHVPSHAESTRILLPVSNSAGPVRGFVRLRKIVRDLNGSLTMMNVVDTKDAMFNSSFSANPILVGAYQIEERKRDLQKIGSQIAKNPETLVTFGTAAQEILKEGDSTKYGWIVMGANLKGLLSRFFGSTAYDVISQAQVPVLTITVA